MLTGRIYGERERERALIEGAAHLGLKYLGYAACVPERTPLIRRREEMKADMNMHMMLTAFNYAALHILLIHG